MRTQLCLLPKVHFLVAFAIAALGLALFVGQPPAAIAQDDGGVVPAGYQSGSFYNKNLGTALRFNYHTQGYGTQDDVFSIGAMKVFDLDDATVYFDGQGTLSDDFGGGFNLGVGYRVLTNSSHPLMQIDPERIIGLGFWTDGQSTASDNFFTQLGFSFESLGESFDTRLNGYFPVARNKSSDVVLTGTGVPFFLGNNIFGSTEAFTVDTAHTVVDSEFAKRINDLEAWAFFGTYHVGGGGLDTTGYRAGVRGYAVPDLALSLQVTDDDTYDTNVMFGVTWFMGRTNKCNGPCGTIRDRFREPVQRNDFIAMTSRRETSASGNALTDAVSNDAIRVVHIDSNAGAGGDGSFENPFDQISDIDASNAANSLVGDILLVHSTSAFVGANGQATLQANQRLLGEGIDADGNQIPHIVATNELGNINMPETAIGSLALARPTIDGTGFDVLTMADGSSVNNFTINGANTAITASGISAPTGSMLANLRIDGGTNALVNGVRFENTTGSVVIENTVEILGATGIGVEINGGSDGLSIAAAINDSTGRSLSIHNRTGGTVDFTGTIDDDANVAGNFSRGVLIDTNVNSVINLTNALDIRVDDGETGIAITANTSTDAATPARINASGAVDVTATGSGRGIAISGSDDTANITFTDLDATAVNGTTVSTAGAGTMAFSSANDTRTIANTGTGIAFQNDGTAASAIVTVSSNVENTGGGSAVSILNRAEDNTIQFFGTVEATGAAGVFAQNNTDGTILFTNTLTLNTAGNNAVELINNTGATMSFSDLDIDTTDGSGFVATGGGTLLITSANNTNDINVTGAGVGVNLMGMTIDPGNVLFDKVGVGSGAGVGINLQNLDGTGQVAIGGGTNAGDGGSLTTTAGTAINVSNATNVALTNLTVSNAGVAQGVNVTGQLAGSTATFTGFEVNTAGADAVNVSNNTDGTITFANLTANTTGAGGAVVANNNAAATVIFNGMAASAAGSGVGFQATGAGNLTVSGTTSVSSNTGRAIEIEGQTIVGGASFDTVDVTGAASGVVLTNVTGANVTIGSGAVAGDGGTISTTGTAIIVNNVAGLTVNNVTVDNDAAPNEGAALSVLNQAAGSTASFNTLTARTTTADAVTVSGNAAGTTIFTGLDVQTTDGTGVTVSNNGTATTTFNGMDVVASGAGVGFTSSGSGTLTATGTNNVTTDTGVAVNLDNTTIGAAGVNFRQVTVTNGSGNGVVLNDLTGGQVTIGNSAAASLLTTTGDAITVTNAANVNINNVDVTTTATGLIVTNNDANAFDLAVDDMFVGNTAAAAVTATHTGTSNFTFAVTNSNFDHTVAINADGSGDVSLTFNDTTVDTAGADVAFALALGNSVTNADVQIRRTNLTADNATAFDFDSNSVGVKNVAFEISNSIVSSSSASATAEIDASGSTVMNAIVITNTFTNTGAGDNFDLAANNAATVLNLNMTGNATNGGTDSVVLRELNVADFNIVDAANFETNNGGVGNFTYDSAGNVIGDFDDIPSLP